MAFSHRVTTLATPEAVWQVWTDIANWHRWDHGLRSASASGPFEEGLEGTLVDRSGRTSRFIISRCEQRRSYCLDTLLPLGKLRVERRIASHSPIAIEHIVSFHGIGGLLLQPLLTRQFRDLLPPSMERLARIAEQLPQSGDPA